MKFVISSSLLSAHLNTLGRVIVQKNNLPILDCFCIEIKGQKIIIIASDNDSTLRTELDLNESEADVRFAVNAKTLQDAIKEIPEQPLEFYLNTSTYELTVVYQNGQYKLMAQNADEYPEMNMSEEENLNLSLSAPILLSGLTRSLIAAANDNYRPQLNAVCFDIKEGTLSMVASNGNHLALTSTKLEGEETSEGTYLLNTRPASLLRNIIGKSEGNVEIKFGQRGAIFHSQEYTLICRLVEGKYPNYRSVIPQNNPNIVKLNRADLISVLRRILVFANPSGVLVKFRLDTNSIVVSSQDVDFGKSAEETMFCEYVGSPMSIAFKGTTLLELIQNIEGEEVVLKLSDPSRAGIILPAEEAENESVLMLIMPSVFNE